jgi:HK97 family phage major capsid protein
MYARFSGKNGIWIANRDTFPQLAQMSLAVGTGGMPVFLPANGAAGMPYNTLMGIPIIFIESCSTVGTVGDIMLVDMADYIVADKGGVEMSSSVHVEFLTNQTVFKWYTRIDGVTRTQSPVTASQGTATYSPYIALATRA